MLDLEPDKPRSLEMAIEWHSIFVPSRLVLPDEGSAALKRKAIDT